ncbi:hypothetical protein D3C72_2191040 [compost metagenome]
MIEGEPPPQGIACQPVVRDTPCGQLAAEPLMGLLEAAHPQPLVAAVARQVQRVAGDVGQPLHHGLPVVGVAEQTVQQYQGWQVSARCQG